jgi:hypothetical protein
MQKTAYCYVNGVALLINTTVFNLLCELVLITSNVFGYHNGGSQQFTTRYVFAPVLFHIVSTYYIPHIIHILSNQSLLKLNLVIGKYTQLIVLIWN